MRLTGFLATECVVLSYAAPCLHIHRMPRLCPYPLTV